MADNLPPLPVPRDADRASYSEFVPFRSKKIRLHKSPVLWFVAVTAVFNVFLFGLIGPILDNSTRDPKQSYGLFTLFTLATLAYMLGLAVVGVHAYAKTDKRLTFYVLPFLVVAAILATPAFHYIEIPFLLLSGGNGQLNAANWLVRIYAAATGPGLREELVKAIPALIGAAIVVRPAWFGWLPGPLRRVLAVRGPLDGVLVGFGAGAAFLFMETGFEYVPTTFAKFMNATHGNITGAFGTGLLLLLPRVMNGWVGHMAWAGITGYAVGLAVVRRRQAPIILLVGWAVAALLHGLWDSSPPGDYYLLYPIGAVGGFLAISCLVKARQMDAALFGRHQETFGSIVAVGTPALATPTQATPTQTTPTPASFQARVAPAQAAPAFAPALPPTPQAAPAMAALALHVGTAVLPLVPGRRLDLEAILGGAGSGVVAEVTNHPTRPDVLGLKNLGAASWQATLKDGSVQPITAGRSLRLQGGVVVEFGAGLIGRVVAG